MLQTSTDNDFNVTEPEFGSRAWAKPDYDMLKFSMVRYPDNGLGWT